MIARKPFRVAAAIAAAVALAAYISHVITAEWDADPDDPIVWTKSFALFTLIVLVACVLAIVAWFAPRRPEPSKRARHSPDSRLPYGDAPLPMSYGMPPPLRPGPVYGTPTSVVRSAAVPFPKDWTADTDVIEPVRHEGARPVAVAEADVRAPGEEPVHGAEVDGYLAATDPKGGTPPDDGYLRGFAIGAVDDENGEDRES